MRKVWGGWLVTPPTAKDREPVGAERAHVTDGQSVRASRTPTPPAGEARWPLAPFTKEATVLHPGDRRLLDDLSEIDDRGLEYAEDLIHGLRTAKAWGLPPDGRIDRALSALSVVRRLTKRP